MVRRFCQVSSILSLLLFVATVVLWVRTYSRAISIKWVPPSGRSDYYVSCGDGGLDFESETYGPATPIDPFFHGGGLTIYYLPVNRDEGWVAQWQVRFRHAGIIYATNVIPQAYYARIFSIPFWLLCLATLVIPVLRSRSRISERRRRCLAGLCIRCGYDLRGSSALCPECGTPISAFALRWRKPLRETPASGKLDETSNPRKLAIVLVAACLTVVALCWYGSHELNSRGAGQVKSSPDIPVPETKSLPPAPSGLTATAYGTDEIDLSWSAADPTKISGYDLQRSTDGQSFSKITQLDAGTTSYNDRDLLDGTTYRYRMLAVNASGAFSSPSAVASATTVLAAPSGLLPTPLDGPGIQLAWVNNSATASTFIVERSTDGRNFTRVTLDADGIDDDTVPGTTYYYRVIGRNGTTKSAPSDVASATAVAGETVPVKGKV